MVEGDLGSVRYPATLLGQSDEVVLPWFILVVALDPAAVLLLRRHGTWSIDHAGGAGWVCKRS
jgi:hypothetical protein